jgi:Na+/H+-dicarboxylate symporter
MLWSAHEHPAAAVAAALTAEGVDAFTTYGSLIISFYTALTGLWAALIAVGALFLGREVLRLIAAVREPMFIAFSTSSTEAAFPKLISSLTAYGVDRRTRRRHPRDGSRTGA